MNRAEPSRNPQLVLSDPAGDGIVRPRNRNNRRLLSTERDQELVSTSGTSTPSVRDASPIPAKYPSRSATRSTSRGSGRGSGGARPVGGLVVPGGSGGRASPQPQGLGGLWEGGWTSSWSALQGLANSVLGTDEIDDSALGGVLKRGKNVESWGPAGLPKKKEDAIGVGSTAERDAAIRARRVKGVLEGRDDDLNAKKDTNGNYKARSSLDETRQEGQHEDTMMVYVHHVQPNDTNAGVILRYNCQPAVFRKANGFWENTSIQTRKTVFIPVDACTIKGRPCEPPQPGSQGVDLLAPTPSTEELPTFTNGDSRPGRSPPRFDTSAERTEREEDCIWTHVRWVLIDSSPSSKPVEIARMPRKTLGYFPPRRRKSQGTISSATTPLGSVDFSSSTPDLIGTTSPQRWTSNSLGSMSSQHVGSYFPPPAMSNTRPRRERRESVSEAADRLGWMRGPGGVGTFNKNVRKPGPSQDGLNAWAKKHLPGLAIDSLPSASLVGGETAQFGFKDELANITEGPIRSGTPGVSTPSGSQSGLGIEHAAAAVEGWIRRLAVKGPGTPTMRGRSDNADLIELLDGTGSDDGRGFELSPGAGSALGGSGREDLDGLLRGRMTAGMKGGKSD
jgi:hypothetical protein